jgi:hypothetical protein
MLRILVFTSLFLLAFSCKPREASSILTDNTRGVPELRELEGIEQRVWAVELKTQAAQYAEKTTMQRIIFLRDSFSKFDDQQNFAKLNTVLELAELQGLSETRNSSKLNNYLASYYNSYVDGHDSQFKAWSRNLSFEERKKRVTQMLAGYRTRYASLFQESLKYRIDKQFKLFPEIDSGSADGGSLLESISTLEHFFEVRGGASLLTRISTIEAASSKKIAEIEATAPFDFWRRKTLVDLGDIESKVFENLK